MRQRALATLIALTTPFALAACGDDSEPATGVDADVGAVIAGAAFPADRCTANQAAGTITYLSGFDYAATASIIEVLVADAAGYYDELCLDVVVTPSFSTANYPLVAANEAQFSSAGSFSEVATFAAVNEADLVTMAVDGHVAIDTLMLRPEAANDLASVAGQTLGVKGKLPPSIAAMLAGEGLIEGADFETVLLDGFDPVAHMAVDSIVGLPGWKSNEPGALERAGVVVDLYDPADYGVPGSFGLIYTNREFLDAHPAAAQDFMRATARGLADAMADPTAAAGIAVDLINGHGNPAFLSVEGETFRWTIDVGLIESTTPADSFPGVPVVAELDAEIAAYDEIGVYGEVGAPATEGRVDPTILRDVYAADGSVIWPSDG